MHDKPHIMDKDDELKMTYVPGMKKSEWPAFPAKLQHAASQYKKPDDTVWKLQKVSGVNQCLATGMASMFLFFAEECWQNDWDPYRAGFPMLNEIGHDNCLAKKAVNALAHRIAKRDHPRHTLAGGFSHSDFKDWYGYEVNTTLISADGHTF